MASVRGDSGNNILRGTYDDDVILGEDGDDTIYVSFGDDLIDGGAGMDRLVIGSDLPWMTTTESVWITANSVEGGPTPLSTSFTSMEFLTFEGGSWNTWVVATDFPAATGGFNYFYFNDYGANGVGGTRGADIIEMGGSSIQADGSDGEDTLILRISGSGPIVFGSSGNDILLFQDGKSFAYATVRNIEHLTIKAATGKSSLEIDASASTQGVEFITTGGGDKITGSAFDDVFRIDSGAWSERENLLAGGDGADVFRFGSAYAVAGTTILDFTRGDVIDLSASSGTGGSAAPLISTFLGTNAFTGTAGEFRYMHEAERTLVQFDFNGDSQADATLTLNDRLRLYAAADDEGRLFLHTSGLAPLSTPSTALNDAISDILWHAEDGTITYWRGTGTGFDGATGFYLINGTDWSVAGNGDLNGDGSGDILWRSDTGGLAFWKASGAGYDGATGYYTSIGTDWQVAGMGDLDGDGMDDIVWRNDNGALAGWISTGTGFNAGAWNTEMVGTDWHVAGVGDVNGDGKDDLVWRGDNGAITVWTSTGNGFDGAFAVEMVSADWHIAGVADFDGDGRDDVLWRSDSGSMTVWTSNGGGFDGGSHTVEWADPSWSVAGTGDYNGDGLADVLLRHVDGGLTYWAGTGNSFDGATGVFEMVDPSWSVVGG